MADKENNTYVYHERGVKWHIAMVLTLFIFLTAVWMIASSGVVLSDSSSDSTPYKLSIFAMVWGILLFIIGAVGAGYIANGVILFKVEGKLTKGDAKEE